LLGVEEAILAAAALALASGRALPLATYVAAGAAAMAASRPGRVPVADAELHAWADTRPELRSQGRFLPDAASVADLARLAPPLAETLPAGACPANEAAAASPGWGLASETR
jgi:hypothetical protein